MNATSTGFTLGVRRIRGIAVALLLLAVLAAGTAYLIHAVTAPTSTTVVHAVSAPAAHGWVNPAGEGHYGLDKPAPNPAGEGHYPG